MRARVPSLQHGRCGRGIRVRIGAQLQNQRVGLVTPCMCVTITQDLGIMQVPSMPDEDEEVAKRPSWVRFVGGRVCETYEAVLTVNLVEETLLVSIKSANTPYVAKLFQGGNGCLWPIFQVTTPAYALGEEEAPLAHVGTVSPRLHSIDQIRRLSWLQPRDVTYLLPGWV